MDYVVENGDAILANQIEIFRRGAAGEPLRTLEVGLDPATIDGPTQWVELWDQGDANGHDLLTGARFPRGYVIPVGDGQRSDSDAAHLVDFLVTHGIEVSRTTAAFTSDGVTHPAGSYVVDMHQPLRGSRTPCSPRAPTSRPGCRRCTTSRRGATATCGEPR